ncbi:MAG: hypothetical protein EAY66_05495 [Sphingobacteriales bacterium]|nr:MAG: hypothetical protein EAY66_05495 [Sphingobacteriales bacterium]
MANKQRRCLWQVLKKNEFIFVKGSKHKQQKQQTAIYYQISKQNSIQLKIFVNFNTFNPLQKL